MTHQPLGSWPKWRDDLITQLRLKDVPGDQIGDILLEVDSHLSDTGETPEEAFGSARKYAKTRVVVKPASPERDIDLISLILIPGIGGFLLATGAFDLGAGDDSWAGLRPWVMLFAGFGLMLWVFLHLPLDLVRDPRSNMPILGGSRRQIVSIALGFFAMAAIIMFALGWFIAR